MVLCFLLLQSFLGLVKRIEVSFFYYLSLEGEQCEEALIRFFSVCDEKKLIRQTNMSESKNRKKKSRTIVCYWISIVLVCVCHVALSLPAQIICTV